MSKIFRFLEYDCTVSKDKYGDGSLALQVWTLNHEPLCRASLNLSNFGIIPPDDHIYVKDYAENQGILAALIDAEIVEPTGVTFCLGFEAAYLCRVLI
jgi:hypothetical protein